MSSEELWNSCTVEDGTVVRTSDADFNILPKNVNEYILPCSTRIQTTTICVNNQDLISLHAEIGEVEIEVVLPSIVPSGNFAELNRTVTCMVLKANDRRTSCHANEFRGPRSDYVRQVALENNNNIDVANIRQPMITRFTCRNCGGGDRGRVAIYRPFGEVSLSLNRTVTCMVLKANDRRTSCPCHDEFVGLVLTTSDRWH
ncbi:uncharacterized protein TNCV_59161 [Trichonephila clavipes]|nr:uncharacterized protein TNCV_59161 [Trichonephila clavipes]